MTYVIVVIVIFVVMLVLMDVVRGKVQRSRRHSVDWDRDGRQPVTLVLLQMPVIIYPMASVMTDNETVAVGNDRAKDTQVLQDELKVN